MTTMNSPSAPQKPKLLDRVREAIRSLHYSRNTEDVYVAWIKRFIFFHGKRHPMEMGAEEITRSTFRSLSRIVAGPLISSKTATIFELSKNSWGTRMSAPR